MCQNIDSTTSIPHIHSYLIAKLLGSKYDSDEHIEQIATRFDESTKRTFRDVNEISLIQFGSVADRDDKYGIRAGKLKLTGYDSTLIHD